MGYFCMGLTAALVKTISWDPVSIVWVRMAVAAIVLFGYLSYKKSICPITHKHRGLLGITGALLAIHWVTFFLAIVVAGIPTAVVSVATIPMFSALFEPILHKKKPETIDLFLGCLVLCGAAILVQDFSLQSSSSIGVLLGITSAICKSLRDINSKEMVQQYGSIQVMTYQLCIGLLVLLPWFHPTTLEWNTANLIGILTIGVLGTSVAHTMVISGFHTLKAVSVNLIGAITPIYQISFGILLVQDMPTLRVFIGGCIIVGISTMETYRQSKIDVVT